MTYRFEGGTESCHVYPTRELLMETPGNSLSLSLEFGRGLSLAGQLHVKGIYHRAEDEPIDRFKQAERTLERRLYHYSMMCYGAWNK